MSPRKKKKTKCVWLYYKKNCQLYQSLEWGYGELVLDMCKTKETNQTPMIILIWGKTNVVQEKNVKMYNKYYEQYLPSQNYINFNKR